VASGMLFVPRIVIVLILSSNGDFAEATAGDENVFIKDGYLVIKPTLQDESMINENNIIDLQKAGTCTGTTWTECHAVTNTTNGTIVPPVKSARINTKKGALIQYGTFTYGVVKAYSLTIF
jgi:hypothetical protein